MIEEMAKALGALQQTVLQLQTDLEQQRRYIAGLEGHLTESNRSALARQEHVSRLMSDRSFAKMLIRALISSHPDRGGLERAWTSELELALQASANLMARSTPEQRAALQRDNEAEQPMMEYWTLIVRWLGLNPPPEIDPARLN